MDEKTANLLLNSLLERLEADAISPNPRLAGVVSAIERTAIRRLLERTLEDVDPGEQPPVEAESHTTDGEPLNEGGESTAGFSDSPLSEENAGGLSDDPATSVAMTMVSSAHSLDETALSFKQPQDDGFVLCLDFGTAKSKAAAASIEEAASDAELLELGLGRRDRDLDSSMYTVSSSVWVSDDGLMFAGSEALRQSMEFVLGDVPRRRLDSIKHQLSLANVEQNLDVRRLESDVNPTSVPLTYEDALCFFLAFLTDTAGKELASQGRSRYMRRRFTIPSWRPAQRNWAAGTLSTCLGRAQILGDTFSGRWQHGIPASEFKAAVAASREHDAALKYLLDGSHIRGQAFPGGLLEPLAAGSGRVWADRATRNLVLVVDVGAGTTDFSLFWVVQDSTNVSRKAFPVEPCSDAVRMAGDILDDVLLKQILTKAHGESNDVIRKRIEADLRLRSLRRLKERLFETGKLEVPLVTDQIVSIDREEFEQLPQVHTIGTAIKTAIATFLESVDESWAKAVDHATLVLTGGSAKLPMIQKLANERWNFGGSSIRLTPAKEVPDFIAETFDEDFQREYPQLAVAIGGALPVLDERSALKKWQGGAADPGGLERYPITGA
jgi:molecular chaperone HscA